MSKFSRYKCSDCGIDCIGPCWMDKFCSKCWSKPTNVARIYFNQEFTCNGEPRNFESGLNTKDVTCYGAILGGILGGMFECDE